jgi:mRNA interferase MazF
VIGPAIRRGEIWWTLFELSTGGELRKTRPAVIVSNDETNSILNRVQIVPMTTNVRRIFQSDALIKIGGRHSKAMADQITTADKSRLRERIGRVTDSEMKALETAIRTQLAL